MSSALVLRQRLGLRFDDKSYRRWVGGKDVIIHCHHYNSRLQKTIEGARQIDGKNIIVSSAEAVFHDQLRGLYAPGDDRNDRIELAGILYQHLGFGLLDFSRWEDGVITAPASHFVEGWNAGFKGRSEPVCSFARGYIQGAMRAATGKAVTVSETECMIAGAKRCSFSIRESDSVIAALSPPGNGPSLPVQASGDSIPSNIDEKKIIAALVEMPIHGNEEGLIPAFGVYLANMPSDFYNLVSIRFVEEMANAGLGETAQRLLYFDAETCGMNTFRGIVSSPEWEGLVAPMVKEERDMLFGVIAVSNGLGWGDWHVMEYEPKRSATLVSRNGYEALGYLKWRDTADSPQCHMLSGVAAGIMELVSLKGPLEERFGTFISEEKSCVASGNEECRFEVRKA